jgi:hypothetical protein
MSELLLLLGLRLVKHYAVAIVLVSSKNTWGSFPAKVAINTVGIHIPRPRNILWQTAVFIGHEVLPFFLCVSLGTAGLVRFLPLFFRESPQVVVAEFGTTGTAARVTILTKRPVTNTNGSESPADIAPDIVIWLIVLVHAASFLDFQR